MDSSSAWGEDTNCRSLRRTQDVRWPPVFHLPTKPTASSFVHWTHNATLKVSLSIFTKPFAMTIIPVLISSASQKSFKEFEKYNKRLDATLSFVSCSRHYLVRRIDW